MGGLTGYGKGSTYKPVQDKDKFKSNWDNIFNKDKEDKKDGSSKQSK